MREIPPDLTRGKQRRLGRQRGDARQGGANRDERRLMNAVPQLFSLHQQGLSYRRKIAAANERVTRVQGTYADAVKPTPV